MRLLQLFVAVAFFGWCFYMGVYVPAQYGAFGNEVESDSRGSEVSEIVAEPEVGESLDD
jgi:hypothetical protein